MCIFNLSVSADAKVILLFLKENEKATLDQLQEITGDKKGSKSSKQVQRYLAEIAEHIEKIGGYYYLRTKLSPVSKSLYINNNNNINNKTNLQTGLVDRSAEIGDTVVQEPDKSVRMESVQPILDKYGYGLLINHVLARLPRNYTPEALEYIVSYCDKKRRRKEIRTTFTRYFLKCLEAMWEEAIIETTRHDPPAAPEIPLEEKPLSRPSADPRAATIWDHLKTAISAPAAVVKMWFETAVPVSYDNNRLVLFCDNKVAPEKIRQYINFPLEFTFHG
jgi:hypothetical protein